jgi:hypothetical protein
MRAFSRATQRQRFGARSAFLRQTQASRRAASSSSLKVPGLTVVDHHYEYVIFTRRREELRAVIDIWQRYRRWRGRSWSPCGCRIARSRAEDGMRDEAVSDKIAYRRRTGRYQRGVGKVGQSSFSRSLDLGLQRDQHDRRRLAMAHVRHS